MLKIGEKKYGVGEPQTLGFSTEISSMDNFKVSILLVLM